MQFPRRLRINRRSVSIQEAQRHSPRHSSHRLRRGSLSTATAFYCVFLFASPALAASPVETVALTGTHAPGVSPSGARFWVLPVPISWLRGSRRRSTPQDRSRFTASLPRSERSDDGYWSGVPSGVQVVAHAGDQAVGLPSGVTYQDFSVPGYHGGTPAAPKIKLDWFAVAISRLAWRVPGINTFANDEAIYLGLARAH